jgi:thiamine transporter ThiT
MNKKIRWITETAVMLALLVSLQAITKPLGQLVTGSCVNAVLAITVLVAGLYSGITVAIISPVLAYLLGIAPPNSDRACHYGGKYCVCGTSSLDCRQK